MPAIVIVVTILTLFIAESIKECLQNHQAQKCKPSLCLLVCLYLRLCSLLCYVIAVSYHVKVKCGVVTLRVYKVDEGGPPVKS